MKNSSRYVTLLLSLALGLGFFMPLWDIQLEAPQYPEGLGMQIWLSKLSGDLNTINGLNHYIGMKEIDPGSIAELRYLPYMLGFLIFLGLLTFLINKRNLLYIWTSVLLLFAAVMAIDFYLWEYDYGHDLDPRAAIKVPGMNYQPPLWGSKVLLNFTAHSYPATGGWFVILVIAGATLLSIKEIRSAKTETSGKLAFSLSLLLLTLLTSCDIKPLEIKYSEDPCSYCHMTITEKQFASGLVTLKGKQYVFDSVECLLQYLDEWKLEESSFLEIKVTDYLSGDALIPAASSYYLCSEEVPSPMGGFLSAYMDREQAQEMRNLHSGDVMDWNTLKSYVRNKK